MSCYMFLAYEDKWVLFKTKQKSGLPGPINDQFNLGTWIQTLIFFLPFYLPRTSSLMLMRDGITEWNDLKKPGVKTFTLVFLVPPK